MSIMSAELQDVSRLPAPCDNCSIALHTLEAGFALHDEDQDFILSHTVLEGHRFAIRSIPAGAFLLSWGMPFGRALCNINPGDYVCNQLVLDELRMRSLGIDLPATPNFADEIDTFEFSEPQFQPAPPLLRKQDPRTFMGFRRSATRGVGTRNTILLLGVSSLVAGFVERLEIELKSEAESFPHIDGIVAVAHTEGSHAHSNNQEQLLRTLSGFIVHPNVGAVLSIDAGGPGLRNAMLRDYMRGQGYPLEDVIHSFMSLRGPFREDLRRGIDIVQQWLPRVNAEERGPQPLSGLKIALQCGGSDAFSGISGNPLAALVSKEVIQAGGAALLAETDELIGAEAYLLQKVRDAETAVKFLETVARFKQRVGWHGFVPDGNPSGGNKLRGLYNIYLKSLGAAVKRHPDVRLDGVLEYGEPMPEAGYYFMDSPGNDLESIAGQVASGCNLIFFVTGNGSVTNFPFVPTIKIVTTSRRYALLPAEMDVNAGAYLEGTSLEELGAETLQLALDVASGQLSAGEKARHAQVQIWRDWPLTGPDKAEHTADQYQADGRPLTILPPSRVVPTFYEAWQTESAVAGDQLGLILPASLCSGQIARIAAQRLNANLERTENKITRFAALVHTEGCGSSIQVEFVDTFVGYLSHPSVSTCLILEHGCEITHNDFWRQKLRDAGLDEDRLGWASVQMNGGIQHTLDRIENWFMKASANLSPLKKNMFDLAHARIGLISSGKQDPETAISLAYLVQQVVGAGGTIVIPSGDMLFSDNIFLKTLGLDGRQRASLAYAHPPMEKGLHVMANPSSAWVETQTGLGATGVDMILAAVSTRAQQSHPFIPILQVAATAAADVSLQVDVDLLLEGIPQRRLAQLLDAVSAALSRTLTPKQYQLRNIAFQITRGELGVSL